MRKQPCDNLVRLLQGCYKNVTTLQQLDNKVVTILVMETQQPCYNLVAALLQPCQIVTQACTTLSIHEVNMDQPKIMVKLMSVTVKCYN